MAFLSFLKSLLVGIFSVFLKHKEDTSECLGEAKVSAEDAQKTASVEAAEAQAAVNAPVSNKAMEDLLRAGKLALLLTFLTSCAHDHGTAYPNCLPLREWSVVDQQNAAADLETLPSSSPVWKFMQDYEIMRSETMACQSTIGN